MVFSTRLALVGAAWLAGVLAVSLPCAAQDAAAAEALFKKGLADLEVGRLDAACPAFAESHRLDPRPGSLFTLAECEAKAGLVASAVVHYGDYLGLFARMSSGERSKQHGRDVISKDAIAKLEGRVPKLTIRIPTDAPADAVVSRDGVVLGRAALGVPLPVDPGAHALLLKLADGRETRRVVSVKEGGSEDIQLELPAAAPTPSPSSEHAAAMPAAETTPAKTGGKTLAYVIGGVGLAGLAVGGITGAMVLGKKSTIEDHCVDTKCDSDGKDAADSAKTLGLVSTIGFGVGFVGLGISTVLLLSGNNHEDPSRARRPQPIVLASERGAWLGIRGSL